MLVNCRFPFNILLVSVVFIVIFVINNEIEVFDTIWFLSIFSTVSRDSYDVILHRFCVRRDLQYFLVKYLKNQLFYVHVWEAFEDFSLLKYKMRRLELIGAYLWC